MVGDGIPHLWMRSATFCSSCVCGGTPCSGEMCGSGRTGHDIMQMVQHKVKLFIPSQDVIDYCMSKKKFLEAKSRCGKGLDI